jgi:signal transduction histidine kinase
VHVEGLRRTEPVRPPDRVHQLLSRDDDAWPSGELGEDAELLHREVQLGGALPGPATLEVEVEIVHAEVDCGGRAEPRPYPSEQLGQPEGLGHVVVGAGVERLDRVQLVTPPGQDEDLDIRRLGADEATDVDAVTVRQAEVEDDELGLVLEHGELDIGHAADRADVVTVASQSRRERLGDALVVLDDEDPAHRSGVWQPAVARRARGERVVSVGRTLRSRLLLAILGATLCVTVAVGLPAAVLVRRVLLDEAAEHLAAQANLIAVDVGDQLAGGRSVNGRRLARLIPPGDRASVSGPGVPLETTGAVVGRERLTASAHGAGGIAVTVATAAGPTEARIRRAWTALGVLGVFALGVAAALAWWQARRVAGPLVELKRSALRLGEGDFSVTAPRSGVRELDDIAASLDASAHRIGDLVLLERQFSSNASHQLRSPLTGLLLRLDTLAAHAHADVRAEAEAAVREAERLDATIEALLQLARTGRAGEVTAVDVVALARWHLDSAEVRLRVANRSACLVAPVSAVARVTPGAVGQALDVLLDNAIVHGAGTVTVTIGHDDGEVIVTVADEGVGIRDVTGLFVRRADGRGVGLDLARRLVRSDGGTLELASRQPAVFRMSLPGATR